MSNRLTVVETVNYQEEGRPFATNADSRFAREVQSQEEAYPRTITVGPVAAPLNFGWAQPCGMLCVKNLPPLRAVNPSPEEAAADRAQGTVILAVETLEFAAIRPGESLRLEPLPGVGLFLRTRGATVRVKILAVPA